MHKINIKLTNKAKGSFITLLIILFGMMSIVFPLLIMYVIPQSGLGHYVFDNMNYAYIAIPTFIYFTYTGIYFYKIKIDPYVIDITSYRAIFSVFQKNDFVDISHDMLADYSFFNRPLSINKTLMLKITTGKGKLISKRFTLSLISEKEVEKISSALDRIIVKNN